jgi:hypothetical protein
LCSIADILGHQYDPAEWRLFLASSKFSLKPVLLHKGNKFPSVPPAHVANMIESYENVTLRLEKIHYEKYNLNICEDLKGIALLLVLQLGYKKLVAFCVNGIVRT